MAATATQQVPQLRDSDGIPPGLDLETYGRKGYVVFSGVFFAQPDRGVVTFARYCEIIFASNEILVAFDPKLRNVYVIDREKRLSLGCRMTADFYPDGLYEPVTLPPATRAALSRAREAERQARIAAATIHTRTA